MAYKVKREQLICEVLEIENIDGTIKTYTPKLSIDTIAREYNELKEKISKLDTHAEEIPYTEIGLIITQILSMVFGKEQALDMIETYEQDMISLALAAVPYLRDVVWPEIEKIKKERIEKYQKLANETVR